MSILKGFFDILKNGLIVSRQRLGTFLITKYFRITKNDKYDKQKLFYYSQIEKRKSFSERFIRVLTLKMDFENSKMPIFKGLQSNRFTWYQKILLVFSLGCKKLWNFVCIPLKFHNCHHANGYPHCLVATSD